MKKLSSLLVALVVASIIYAQTPIGFSYQAVLRNTSGQVLSNQAAQLRVSLISSNGLTTHYQEVHNITSTAQGLINVIIGEGIDKVGLLADVPWGKDQINMRTEIKVGTAATYSELGLQSLQAVPYALYANNTKEVNSSPTAGEEDPIFVVRNKLGQIVFAVYQEGVRVYVDNGSTTSKGLKGGFAVGGLSGTKESAEYFRITPDSARIYINDKTAKGAKGGFAVGGLSGTKLASEYLSITPDSTRIYVNDQVKGAKGGFAVGGLSGTKGSNHFFDVSTDATGIINPSQKRVLWYPIKNAFLAGRVLIESPDSVGENSFASGYESKAKGIYSQAMGYMSIARGDYSSAFGRNALAHASNSFAFGWGAKATKSDSYAFGTGAEANGLGSYAIGSVGRDTVTFSQNTRKTLASGDYSFALGLGAQATSGSAFAIGQNATASNVVSFALGSNSVASGRQSTALGALSVASGNFSTALSAGNSAGWYSSAMGYLTQANGSYAISIGSGYVYSVSGMSFNVYSRAQGSYSIAIGNGHNANGAYSTTLGYRNYTYGEQAMALGANLIARSYGSVVVGAYNYDDSNYSTFSWVAAEPIFVVGNGTYGSPSNALTVLKNGNTGIGTQSPSQKLDVNGNARFRSVGSGAYNNPLNITSDGTLTTATSDVRLKEEISTLENALTKVMQLRGVSFKWKKEPSMGKRIGFIAQEIEQVFPELVFTNETDGYKGVNYAEMTAVLVEAMKEQQTIIDKQQKELDLLKAELEEIKKLLSK